MGGTISTDTTWTLAGSPYIATSNIIVQGTDGADGVTTLTLDPGVTLKFNSGKYLQVGSSSGNAGALVAQGTVDNPVIFTSGNQSPAPGDWGSIQFYATAHPSTKLENCIIRYAGQSMNSSIYFQNASADIINTTIENSSTYGIYYYGTVGGTVSGCTINSGIYLGTSTSSVSFANNTFNHNNAYPTSVIADNVHSLVNGNNTFNSPAYIKVTSGNVTKDATWTSAAPIFINSLIVQGTDGADGVTTLALDPGATLKFNSGKYLQVGSYSGNAGALIAQGTVDNPVIFTSINQSPAPGDWGGIQFLSTADPSSTLEHCHIKYAGISQTSVYIYNTSINILNSAIENSNSYDLRYVGTVGGNVSGCVLNSGIDLSTSDSSVDFSENVFNQNNSFPTKAYADGIHSLLNGNTFANLDESSRLEVIGGNITKDANWTASLPICLKNNLRVQGTDGEDGITTLTIEPGSKIIFNMNKFIDIGDNGGAPGALSAIGTAENMIIFTSNQTAPVPGDWGNLRFWDTADDNASALKYCIIEYGGYGGAAIYLYNAKPSIEHSIVRYSSSAGVLIYGSGSNGALISCNTMAYNKNGIACIYSALPIIQYNNFIGNTQYGVSNGQIEVNAENNWWGDAQGPNTGGDKTNGNVDAEPWSLTENDCIPAQENHPPNMPANPIPNDNAVRVALSSGSAILQWTGGDPDLKDIVTYSLNLGTATDALAPAVQQIIGCKYQITDLLQGVTYYWQIVAKDNRGMQTVGPIWCFTTDGDPPDIIVGNLTINPAGNIQPTQDVTFRVTVQNNGGGPVVDPFAIDFLIDGASIGQHAVNTVISSGNNVEVSWSWTYNGGNPLLEIIPDNQNQVAETNEDNNRYTALLSEVADMTAPALVSYLPSNDSYLKQIEQISLTLADSQSTVDDAAVMSSFRLIDEAQLQVAGTISESNDTFVFVPNLLPLNDGAYQVSFNSIDIHGNMSSHTFGFTIDSTPPQKPVITGGIISSGPIRPRPEANLTDQFSVELTGTREAGTRVHVNGSIKVDFGDTDWSTPLSLQPVNNAIEVFLVDRAGNQGPSEWVDIEVTTAEAVQYEYDAGGRVKTIHSNQQ